MHWLKALTLILAIAGPAAAAWGGTVSMQVNDAQGRALGDAVVFMESADAARAAKPLPGIEMSQRNKAFDPVTLVVTRGTAVDFPNRDTVRHHVYSFSPVKKFELKLYTGTPANPVVFDRAGVVTLGCNIHDRMVGWIVVVDTPYYARAAEGAAQVQINGVPAGNYKLRVWHPRMAPGAAAHEQPVAVPATGNVRAAAKLVGLAP